jgi:hypothetical protein
MEEIKTTNAPVDTTSGECQNWNALAQEIVSCYDYFKEREK